MKRKSVSRHTVDTEINHPIKLKFKTVLDCYIHLQFYNTKPTRHRDIIILIRVYRFFFKVIGITFLPYKQAYCMYGSNFIIHVQWVAFLKKIICHINTEVYYEWQV